MVRPDGFVLAGGASVRMGQDKASVRLQDGRRLGDAVAAALAGTCGRVGIVRREPDDGWPELDVVTDLDGPRHALTGVATALRAATTPRVLLAPCDLPQLTAAHIAQLWALAGEGEAVASHGEQLQPLLGVFWAARWSHALEAARDGASVRRWTADVPRVVLPAAALVNANHPGDLPGRASAANRH